MTDALLAGKTSLRGPYCRYILACSVFCPFMNVLSTIFMVAHFAHMECRPYLDVTCTIT